MKDDDDIEEAMIEDLALCLLRPETAAAAAAAATRRGALTMGLARRAETAEERIVARRVVGCGERVERL